MGFSGGGSNVLKSHTHDGTVVQDGGALNFNNITQSQSAAGEVFYSDGVHLQQLAYPAVPAGETLTAAAASTAPSWAAPGAAGAWELLDNQTISGTTNTFTVNFSPALTFSDYSFIKCVLTVSETGGTGQTDKCTLVIDGIAGTAYNTQGIQLAGGVITYVNRTSEANCRIVDGWGVIEAGIVEIEIALPVYGSANNCAIYHKFASDVKSGFASSYVTGTGNSISSLEIEVENDGGTPTREMRLQTYGVKV
jgi:hypothetical protein